MNTYIFGNWKQQGSLALLKAMLALPKASEKVIVSIFPPAVYLAEAARLFHPSHIQLGAQNVSAYPQGAYTGEIGAAMLHEVGCAYTLVGHSERRQFFGDTEEVVARKFEQASVAGLVPVLCVGETLAEYEKGKTQAVIEKQLAFLSPSHSTSFLLAYEPVWAIGTGKAATDAQANEIHLFIRELLVKKWGEQGARIPLLYGGSVKADNAQSFLAMSAINGLLIGGASLIPEQFAKIVMEANLLEK